MTELSNLNRQRFFAEDLYASKAERLAKNLSREAVSRCLITGYQARFQTLIDEKPNMNAGAVICGVDNNETRVAVARFFLVAAPVVIVAVSEDAEHGYVFVQEPGKACYACLFPHAVGDDQYHPCGPSVVDILKVVAGVALYAVDSLVMPRRRTWNYREVFLAGDIPDRAATVERRPDCLICGEAAKSDIGE